MYRKIIFISQFKVEIKPYKHNKHIIIYKCRL